MSKSTKTYDIQHNVFVELLPVIERNLDNTIGSFRIVAVDMENRQRRHSRDIGGVNCRAPCFWRGCEPDLVVDDDVNSTARSITFELRKVQRFHNDALPCKGGIAVQQNRQYQINNSL